VNAKVRARAHVAEFPVVCFVISCRQS